MKQGERVLVTGGAGFIGFRLCGRLIARGYKVNAIDNLSGGKEHNLSSLYRVPAFRFEEGDTKHPQALSDAMKGCSVVFHLAARPRAHASIADPLRTNRENVDGTLSVLECARALAVRQVIFASSSSVYGNNPVLPKIETMVLEPASPYAASKVAGESYCTAYGLCFGMQVASLRYFSVYGPRQNTAYATVIPSFIDALRKGKAAIIYGDGEQTRDFTYVDDAVAATILVAEAEAEGIFNVSGGTSWRVNVLLEEVARQLGCQPRAVHAPPRPGDVRHSSAYLGAISRLGYKPQFDLRQGLEKTIAYYTGLPT